MFRKAVVERAKHFEQEVVTQKHETLETKLKHSEVRIRDYHTQVEHNVTNKKREREAKLDVIDELHRQMEIEKEQVRRAIAIDKENYEKMMKEREKIQNQVKQMSIKLQAEKERKKMNPI